MKEFDLAIIGAGPGGYVGAIRATQLGLKTVIIEKDKPGGVCLNIGCIPSKALIHQAEQFHSIKDLESMGIKVDISEFDYKQVFKRSRLAANKLSKGVQFLLRKNKVDYIAGEAIFKDKNTLIINKEEVKAKNIIIATGSKPHQIPGFKIDEEDVLSSTGALMLEQLPKRMLIIGAGAIGAEAAHLFNRFGVEIHIVEVMENIVPMEDEDVSKELEKIFKKRKIKTYTSTKAIRFEKSEDGLTVTLKGKDNKEKVVTVDKILLAVGRDANIEGLGLEKLGVEIEKGNFIKTKDYYETSVSGIYAIGDVLSSPALAHVASKEAEIAVEHIAGHNPEKRLDSELIPEAVYCEPEIGNFGLREKNADKDKHKVSKFPYKAIGRATVIEWTDGFIKLITDKETGMILGGSIIGAQAAELIHEILLAKSLNIPAQKIAELIHAHPTLSEGVMEAARMSQGWAIHV